MNDQGKACMKTKRPEWKVPEPTIVRGRVQRVEGMQYMDRKEKPKK